MPLTGLYAQAPVIEWENTIKGSNPDYIKGMSTTTDGGYILACESSSGAGFDKTSPSHGGTDYWIIKLKPNGEIKWQKGIGGSLNDDVYGVTETSDGGYVIGGTSYSGISGNKTEASLGGTDFWIVKLSASGNLLWQNTIGGSSNDNLFDITSTSDGGVVIIGQSSSGVSGDKTEPVTGGTGDYDYWIVKLSAVGIIEWQQTIGGIYGDIGGSIRQLSDGGYIIGGISWSGATGDKTEPNIGGSDLWILRLSSTGDIIWQNTIGTTDFESSCVVKPTSDGGFIVGTSAYAYANGDKTEVGSNTDYWILKLNNFGDIIWQNTIVGLSDDFFSDIIETNDGGFLVGGVSNSDAGYDKSEDRLNDDPYLEDLWIVKLNNIGNILWENTIGGNGGDYLYGDIGQAGDGGYVIGASSGSSASADKSENSNLLSPDLWMIKTYAYVCLPSTELCNGIDDNCNGLIDDGVVNAISISADGSSEFCSGGSVNLFATYSGTSVQWYKNGIIIPGASSEIYTANTKGYYSCTTFNACDTVSSDSIFINVYKLPTAFISPSGATTFCAGGSVTLTETPSGGCTYQWYKGATPIAGATSTTYVATTTGNYKCRVTKTATGCYKNSNAIAVSVPCREGELLDADNVQINVYPNPARSTITIQSSIDIPSTIQIRDMVGQLIIPEMSLQGLLELNVTAWPAGIYFLQSTTENDIIVTQFIKQ